MNKKQILILTFSAVWALFILTVGIVLGVSGPRPSATVKSLAAEQINNEQRIKVVWNNDFDAEQVEITVKKSNGVIDNQILITNPQQVAKNFAYVDASYGKNTVEVKAYNGKKWVKKSTQVNVFTDEYVIAPLVATMPVTIFSLDLASVTQDFSIPTFVWLERGGSWDYKQMPENVHLIPFGEFKTMSQQNLLDNFYIQTSLWIKELYEINNNSTFHIYCNDYHPFVWLQMTYANHIPADKYDVTLLTDGTATVNLFNQIWDKGFDTTAVDKYNAMEADYNAFKQYVWNKNDCTDLVGERTETGLAVTWRGTHDYVMHMLREESNIKLILTKNYAPVDATVSSWVNDLKTKNKIKVVSLYNDLLKTKTDAEKEMVKKLYKIGDAMFEDALKANKQPMVILGTSPASEANFDDYIAAMRAYYGDGYLYYYKGHPSYPIISDPERAAHFRELGLLDLDATIPAELIFYFNLEAVGAGYGSSTFISMNDEQIGCVWNVKLANVNSNYKEKMKLAISKLSSGDATYGTIADDNCYLFEFADTTNYDIAIYNKANNTLKFYQAGANNSFVEVSR